MSAFEAHNPFDLLGQAPPPAPALKLHGSTEPQLEIGWGQFHQGVASNFVELFRRSRLQKLLAAENFFRDSWVERRIPRRAIFAAALWHIAFLVTPFPQFSAPKRNHAFDNSQITWSGPVEDFPLIRIPAAKMKPRARGSADQPPAPAGADAFHPRQTIFTDPVHPTHPRQTLINPAAPLEAPTILPELPNMVQLAQSAAPVRPRLEISQRALKMLHPREKRVARDNNTAAPELQSNEQRDSALSLIARNSRPERPKLQINSAVAPRAAQRKQDGANEPTPEVSAQLTAPNGGAQALIALSAAPGPSAPVAPPAGNLAARLTISPEGKNPGVPGGSPEAKTNSAASADATAGGAGTSSVGISITGGAPKSASTISALGSAGKLAMPSIRPNYSRVEAARTEDEPQVRGGPPNFATLAPGAKPEAIFGRRRVYSMNVNMPNLSSATGSWILNFSELRSSAGPRSTGELAEPSPLHKVDPKYPPTLIAEHVEGEVILYAIIRRDGSVDSIQVVHGIDELLDGNAVRALAQWKFRPAERNGEPVELEAIVHIPFRAPELR